MGQQGEEEEEACCSAAPAGENPLQTDALPPLQHDQAPALNLPAQGFFFFCLSSHHAVSFLQKRKHSRPPQAHPFVLSRVLLCSTETP